MINLFTSYFKSDRDEEYKHCLEENLKNEHISKVILFEEDDCGVSHNKLVKVRNGRPTYQDFFNLTQDYPDDVNVISNSDIFFNTTIELANRVTPQECYAITRHEWRNGRGLDFQAAHGKTVDHAWSQDVWIFRGVVRIKNCDTVLAENLDNHAFDMIKFYMGIGGCDNVIARRINEAGYLLKNPYTQIHCFHYHKNEGRPTYSHRITGNRTRWGGLQRVPLKTI